MEVQISRPCVTRSIYHLIYWPVFLLSWQTRWRSKLYVALPSLLIQIVKLYGAGAKPLRSVNIYVTDKHIYSSQTEWNLIFAVIRSTLSNPEASRLSFELLEKLSLEGPDEFVTVDNFSGMITVLDEFASTAGATVEAMHKGGRRVRMPTAAEYVISSLNEHSSNLMNVQLIACSSRSKGRGFDIQLEASYCIVHRRRWFIKTPRSVKAVRMLPS